MTSISEVLAAVRDPGKRATAAASILLDGSLVERHRAADQALAEVLLVHAATMDADDPPAAVQDCMDAVADIEAQMAESRVEFRFRALSFREWADLLAAHPPTKEQKKGNEGLQHNPDTFPAAAVAASCTEPAMSEAEAGELLDALHPSQRDLLWGTCLALNRGDVDAPKSRFLTGRGPRSNGVSVGPLTGSASLDPSSSDGS